MRQIKVAAAVLNQTPMDWAKNKQHILAAIARAKSRKVGILCLPELAICGYGCEDAFHSDALHRTAYSILCEILPKTRGIVVCLGLPVLYRNGLFNCAALVADGKILGFAAKRHLAGDGLHYEPRWFKSWPAGVRSDVTLEGAVFPIGDIYFEVGGVRLGFEICEDAWAAKRTGSDLSLKGVDIILNPSASHFAFGKFEIRKRFVQEGSRAFNVSYIYANLMGNESGKTIYDGGALIASCGALLAQGPRFSYKDVHLTEATIDITRTRMSQARTGSFDPLIAGRTDDRIVVSHVFPAFEPDRNIPKLEPWESSPQLQEEEFSRAISLALFDYMRKSHTNGFVVSLSGGADSAACCALVFLMVRMALKGLGEERLLEKLEYLGLSEFSSDKDPALQLMPSILTCVYQATRNSSETTHQAARTLAEAIGARFLHFDVDPIVESYVSMLASAVNRPLTWEQDDITLQNIQARVRSPGGWMLANLHNALLLATSNRSEAAVGYATMDGDTCGGLSPIAGIDKHFLRQWLKWLEEKGPYGFDPVPALKVINTQTPTAELRPGESQTDEEDLMPYPLLDAIEGAAIRDKKKPLNVFKLMMNQFPEYKPEELGRWVTRFFRLWCRNQWKRERYAPSFHVDDTNLDPKTWCRFPILSGGFERELKELQTHLKNIKASRT